MKYAFNLNFAVQVRSLIIKELTQILRDRQLVFLLVIMPVMQITLYSLALSPEVEHLRLGVIDLTNSATSRELVSAMVENRVFDLLDSGGRIDTLAYKVREGQLDAGVVIPPEFEREIKSGHQGAIQVVLDGVDANSSGIATGYISQIVETFNNKMSSGTQNPRQAIQPQMSFAYNPGLDSKWFFVPGVMAYVLNLVATLVSSSAVIREKDEGTLEQLLMTPVSSMQILLAKIVPLSIVLMSQVLISLFVAIVIFGLPFRGNIFLYLLASFLSILVGIGMGIALAAYSQNQRQALLTSFFINLPTIQLSGALSPVESMPEFWQKVAVFNPLKYYVNCVRAILLKGAPFEAVWPDIAILFGFAALLIFVSSSRFRKQLQ